MAFKAKLREYSIGRDKGLKGKDHSVWFSHSRYIQTYPNSLSITSFFPLNTAFMRVAIGCPKAFYRNCFLRQKRHLKLILTAISNQIYLKNIFILQKKIMFQPIGNLLPQHRFLSVNCWSPQAFSAQSILDFSFLVVILLGSTTWTRTPQPKKYKLKTVTLRPRGLFNNFVTFSNH